MTEDLLEMEVDNGRIFFTAIPAKTASLFCDGRSPRLKPNIKLQQDYKASFSNA